MEGELVAVGVAVDVAVAAAGAKVELFDRHVVAARSEPLLHEIGFGVGPEHCGDRCVELPLEVDERHAVGSGDGEGVGAH